MYLFLILFSCLTIALLGAVAGAAVATWYLRQKEFGVDQKANLAAEVLEQLQALAARVAVDVDDHNTQVQEINKQLVARPEGKPTAIVDVVAKLIEANQRMHEKLSSTETRLRQQAEEMQAHVTEARTDALTLLPNRRAFDDELSRRAAEFVRQGHVFSLIMVDVDHFKQFNDRYGHQSGDEVLRGVAKALRRKMREMDLVARIGGEEFAIVLPGTAFRDAERAGLRAADAVRQVRFRAANEELRVTASFGVAQINSGDDPSRLIAHADKALYAAKENGRNCVFGNDGDKLQAVVPDAETPSPKSAGATSQADPPHPPAESKVEPAADEEALNLPKLLTRTTFCQLVRTWVAEHNRGGPTVSVVLAKMNGVGETSGNSPIPHLTWRQIAALTGDTDRLGLYAPGFFAILLPAAPLAVAVQVAERLRACLLQAEHDQNSGPRSLTMGIAEVCEYEDSISLLRRAEEAMNAAGRRDGEPVFYHDGRRCYPVSRLLESSECAF